MGGFECSTQRNLYGKRLDMIAATQHDKYIDADYKRIATIGIKTIRDGVRWHLVEEKCGQFNFNSVLPMIQAANKNKIQVLWDLCHYGWPDDIDIFKPEFVRRFAKFAKNFVQLLINETDTIPVITPINEISYFSWACGQVGYMYPFSYNKGIDVQKQLVRATIEATEEIWNIAQSARILNVDPVIFVTCHSEKTHDCIKASLENDSQYQARDMLTGRINPELGGAEKYLDIVGVNYYPFNQWIYGSGLSNEEILAKKNYPIYKPFHQMLIENYERYKRPIIISETGTEGDRRAEWLHHIMTEVSNAQMHNVPIKGVCWYPIVNNPHWDDNRHCLNGLWDYADETGNRAVHTPLADELLFQQQHLCIK